MKPLGLLMAIMVSASLVACGSSGFHSATHVYSARQVEAAFAGHGIALHKVERHPAGTVELSGTWSRYRFPIHVYVAASLRSARYSAWAQAVREAGYSPAPVSSERHGNVLLLAAFRSPGPIDAALADLH